MKDSSLLLYLLAMALVTNVLRILPVTVFRKKIESRFFRSFLYYVPYVTLAVMTVPAIIDASGTPLAGLVALLVGIVAAWFDLGIFIVALICCAVVLVAGLI